LEGFSKALANLKFDVGQERSPIEPRESQAAIPYVGVADESSIKLRIADESSIKLRIADESSIKLRIADESSIKLRIADESSIKLRIADSESPYTGGLPTESSSRKRTPDADQPIPFIDQGSPQAMFLGDIRDSSAIATLSAENADTMIQDAGVFQRISNFQSTLQQILSLNRGLEGK
jgi:hypothetical protein